MLKTGQDLGIDSDELANKCARFSEFYVKHLMEGSEERQNIIDKVRTDFIEQELVFMSINFLHDRTIDILKEQMKESFARTQRDLANTEAESLVKPVSNDTGV